MTSSNSWHAEIESLGTEFRDLRLSYPKLFAARVLTKIHSAVDFSLILQDQKILNEGSSLGKNPSSEIIDHWAIYANEGVNWLAAKHGQNCFDALARKGEQLILQAPDYAKALLPTDEVSDNWLAFLDNICSSLNGSVSGAVCKRDQYVLVQDSNTPARTDWYPVALYARNPENFQKAFSHIWFAILSPDIATVSEEAIKYLIKTLPSTDSSFSVAQWNSGETVETYVNRGSHKPFFPSEKGEPDFYYEFQSDAIENKDLINQLALIEPGTKSANMYHRTVAQIIKMLCPELSDMKIEQPIHEGRKKIDITFSNQAQDGFFHELTTKHSIHCPYIFFECKNYSDDPANPEIDQLLGRLDSIKGMFGILVTRKIENERRLFSRCSDAMLREKKFLIWLTDDDLEKMWDFGLIRANHEIKKILSLKLQNLILTTM